MAKHVFIAARSFAIANWCAGKLGLLRREWSYLDDPVKLRGHRKPVVILHESADLHSVDWVSVFLERDAEVKLFAALVPLVEG